MPGPTDDRATSSGEPRVDILRNDDRPSRPGPAAHFTGRVRIDPLFDAPAPARAACACVTFEPGARTGWHAHALGQTLVVLSGVGRVQREGGPVETIRAGDVVWIAPGERHWHGAAPGVAMQHIAVQDRADGQPTEWGTLVSDEEYGT